MKNDTISYMGRKDNMIKRYGHRINISYIENEIANCTNLQNHLIWFSEVQKLILFFKISNVDEKTKYKTIDKLRIQLLHNLPKESMPDDIEIIQNLPLTINGKVDKNALKVLYKNSIYYSKENLTGKYDQVFKYLIKKYLGLNDFLIEKFQHHTFLELGGNSIIALQLLSEYKQLLKHEYPPELVQALFEDKLSNVYDLTKSINFQQDKLVIASGREDLYKNDAFSKSNMNFKIKWKYNLQACIDSTCTIIQNK